MKILDLKQFQALVNRDDVKVLRHKDSRLDLWAEYRNGKFGRYQDGQSWDVFGRARIVISFIAERNRYARFVGVWEVRSKRKKKARRGYRYRTREVPGFDSLKERLVVRWGEGTRSWAQWLHRQGNKDVSELLPEKYVAEFPGLYNILLSYDELKMMAENPDANREWVRRLSDVSGVYLILDQKSGKQYVGSAYGRGGIWSRWKAYAKNPSGGNKMLKTLIKARPTRYKYFQFSVLRVLEPGETIEEVLNQESKAKRKLGSRATGLNSN